MESERDRIWRTSKKQVASDTCVRADPADDRGYEEQYG